MAGLISLALAKEHLRILDADHDSDVQRKADHASAIVLDYLKDRANPAWTPDTLPLPIQAAMLLMLGHLYEHRGDDLTPDTGSSTESDKDVWLAIERLVIRHRDPALA